MNLLLLATLVSLQIPGAQDVVTVEGELLPNIFDAPISEVDAFERRFITMRDFVSPVTGERFSAYVLTGLVGMGERDHDGCPHPPLNALGYSLVIDPYSGYVAYPEQFGALSRWTLREMQEVLGPPRFSRSTPPGQPWANAYPWEKYENAARLAIAAKEKQLVVGQWWLQAAWSVRLDMILGESDFTAELSTAARSLPMRGPDPSRLFTPHRVQLAEYWGQLHESGRLGDVTPQECALAIAWLYRSRGELPAARLWLGRSGEAEPGLKRSPLYTYLQNSILLEREYLVRARDTLTAAWEAGDFAATQRGGAAFLLGELHRRLGDAEKALIWYDEAYNHSLGQISPGLLRQQRELVAAGKLF